MRQRRLAVREAPEAGAEQHVGAVLDQRHEADLREGALATAGPGAAEGGLVLRRVGDVEAGAVQADQPPPLQLPTSFLVESMLCWLPSEGCPSVLSPLKSLHF